MSQFKSNLIKRLALRAVAALTIAAMVVLGLPTQGPKAARAGEMTGVSAASSSSTKGGATNITIKFKPATTSSTGIHVSVNFNAPPDAKFGVGGATLGAGSSSVFTAISDRNAEFGSVGFNVSALTAGTEYTIILNSVTNPTKEGKYGVEIQTHSGFNQTTDTGKTSVTVGTIAIQGTVTLPSSTAARGAWVNAQEKGNFSSQNGSPSGADGSYGIGGLTAGKTYIINVFLGGGDPNSNTKGFVSPDSVEVAYSGTTVTQNFTLKTASKTVTGTLKRANGQAIAGGRVMANRMDAPGWVNAQTNSSGLYTLLMSGGGWEIRPDTWAGPGQTAPDYAYSGPGTPVKFAKNDTAESKTGVDFTVVTASATITGTVNPKPSGFSGVGIFNRGGFGTGTGIDQSNGTFTAKVPPGTYEMDLFSDPSQGGDRYAFPQMDPVTVGENQTKNLGVINLVKMDKTINAIVRDSASKNGIAGFDVYCFKPRGGGFSNGRTGADGKAPVPVTGGSEWGCMAHAGYGGEGEKKQGFLDKIRFVASALAQAPGGGGQNTKYVVQGGPQFVKVGDTPVTLTYDAVVANRSIAVTVTNASGSPISEHGFIEAELVGSDVGKGFDKGGGLGQPIDPNQPGMATLQVPAGIYDLRMMTPPGSAYSSGDPVRVDVKSGNASATIKLFPNDAVVNGTLKDEDGKTVTGVFAFVTATNKKGAFIPGEVNQGNGTFTMNVPSAGGELALGYHVDPATGYFPQPFSDNKVTPTAGSTTTRDIVMKKATATAVITVKNPNGDAVANAFVSADNRKAERGGFKDNFFGNEDKTAADGKVTLKFPAGEYNFEAGLPHEQMRANKWMPESKKVTLEKDKTTEVTLQFKSAGVEVKGQLKDASGNVMSEGLVTLYSENGESITAETNSNGDYSVNITSGKWHAVGEKDNTPSGATKPEPLISSDTTFDTGTNTSITQNLTLADQGDLSSTVSSTYDTDNAKLVSVTDGELKGAQVSIPADALDLDSQGSNATVTVETTVELPRQLLDKPLGGIALEVTAQDSSGQPITDLNSANVAITIPIEQGDLKAAGFTVADIGKSVTMSYVNETDSYTPLEGSVTAQLKDNTGDGDTDDDKDLVMVTGNTDHFTAFAVTASTDTTPPSAPTNAKAEAGTGKITLTWINPTDTDFDKINIYRSTTEGTLGDKLTTTAKADTSYDDTLTAKGTYYYTLRSVDTTGNESVNTDQVSAEVKALPKTGRPANNSGVLVLITLLAGAAGLALLRRYALARR